jgi:hypothetical protein
MKQIDYRGGIVRFLIPESWVEEYEDAGGGTFYEDRPGCGTLRLNVITAKKPADTPDAKRALMALMDRKRPANSSLQVLGNGNVLCRYRKSATEDGHELVMHYWEIGNVVDPTNVRLAIFSFAVLASESSSGDVLRDLAMLEEQLPAAEFHEGLGELPPMH